MAEGKYLLRLEHQFEVGEEPWDNTVSVSLAVSFFVCLFFEKLLFLYIHMCGKGVEINGGYIVLTFIIKV